MPEQDLFTDKAVLITGGTGTFGTAFLERLLRGKVREVRVFSRDEKKQEDLRRYFNSPKVRSYIGDVRDYNSVLSASAGVDYIFHAAALKQVPSCEFHPLEALRTNALGAENTMNAAIANRVKKMIVLSTDKAVYPINAMGLSKAMMEKLMIAKARTGAEFGTVLCGTRYGNVMASRGSVIPLFIDQIKRNRQITVTDPQMTRFMMSIDDAIDLVLYAFEHGRSGDMFVQKAPAATVETLAIALKLLFKSEIPIEIIGTRHGEKLFEALLTREEMAHAQDQGVYYRVAADYRDLNYDLYFTQGEEKVSRQIDYTSENTERLDVESLTKLLLSLAYVQSELSSSGDTGSEFRLAR